MYKRIVVKVGTGVLSKSDATLDQETLVALVKQIAHLKRKGVEIILVTSGAVGMGRSILTLHDGASDVVQKQVFASVGQVKLMNLYADAFEKEGYLCAQVLATKEDFRDTEHYTNMKNCLENLLHDTVVPVINENDVVAVSELMFTDNDELAGLIASQLSVDAIVILTSVDGVLAGAEQKVVSEVQFSEIESMRAHVLPDRSTGGRGGMTSKFVVATSAAERGIVVHIASGKRENVLIDLLEGQPVGTKFLPKS